MQAVAFSGLITNFVLSKYGPKVSEWLISKMKTKTFYSKAGIIIFLRSLWPSFQKLGTGIEKETYERIARSLAKIYIKTSSIFSSDLGLIKKISSLVELAIKEASSLAIWGGSSLKNYTVIVF